MDDRQDETMTEGSIVAFKIYKTRQVGQIDKFLPSIDSYLVYADILHDNDKYYREMFYCRRNDLLVPTDDEMSAILLRKMKG